MTLTAGTHMFSYTCTYLVKYLYHLSVYFLWLSLPGHYRVTDEALLAETTNYILSLEQAQDDKRKFLKLS